MVDDSSIVRKIARRILEALDFQVIEAEDGVEALVVCKRAMPEAILLDWNMPVMDGFQFLGTCAACPAATNPRSCSAPPKTASTTSRSAMGGGANEYIMKPFDKDIVADKFQEIGLIQPAEPA